MTVVQLGSGSGAGGSGASGAGNAGGTSKPGGAAGASSASGGRELIALSRECKAIEVPAGTTTVLPEGTEVVIYQQLGDSYTVSTPYGLLVRIDGEDADALGKEPPPPPPGVDPSHQGPATEDMVWAALKTVFDPEIPVNIVDLGLVYTLKLEPEGEDGVIAKIEMTLTAPGCGMGEVIRTDCERKVSRLPGVKQAIVDLVFDPPWEQAMMSEAARLQLGMMW